MHRCSIPRVLLAALTGLGLAPAGAQGILVTTGEHADFTRVVLQSSRPIDWQLDTLTSGATSRKLTIDATDTRIDISRAFQRIPRTRLADLVLSPGGLEIRLNCDCPIRAWTESAGLVVLDIANPQPDQPPTADASPQDGDALVLPRPGESDLAHNAGTAFARTWRAQADTAEPGRHGPAPSPIVEAERIAIMRQLTSEVAGALTQGILDPSPDRPAQDAMIRLNEREIPSAIPPNLRVMSVLERPDDEASRLPDDQPNACAAAAALDFATSPAPGNFNTALAAGLTRWVGEFDLPEQAATEALVILYLQHGFGAEARALLESAVGPVPGRDLLLGLADTLEGRQSNSRLRLAGQYACSGAAAMFAALAGAPLPQVRARAADIASSYAQAPGILRVGLGGALVQILIAADAVDAGRVVADTLRRTPNARSADLHLADTVLDLARGEILQAGARLSHEGSDDVATVLLRLRIALETGAVVPESVLLNAEAIASTHRATTQGSDLLASVVRLRTAAGAAGEALGLVDRLEGWVSTSADGTALIEELADIVWFGLALQASDADLLDMILNRNDWRNPSFSNQTRAALAERLRGFGFSEAAELLASPSEADQPAGHPSQASDDPAMARTDPGIAESDRAQRSPVEDDGELRPTATRDPHLAPGGLVPNAVSERGSAMAPMLTEAGSLGHLIPANTPDRPIASEVDGDDTARVAGRAGPSQDSGMNSEGANPVQSRSSDRAAVDASFVEAALDAEPESTARAAAGPQSADTLPVEHAVAEAAREALPVQNAMAHGSAVLLESEALRAEIASLLAVSDLGEN